MLYVRFQDKEQAQIFITKLKGLDKATSPVHLRLGEKISATPLNERDHKAYLAQAAKDREEYHKYLGRVKKYQSLSKKQRRKQQK